MDAYGQIGPDKPGYPEDLDAIAAALNDGRPVSFDHSHRMTLTELVITPAPAIVRFHRPGRPGQAVRSGAPEVLVSVVSHGAAWLPLYGDIDGDAVTEHLGIRNRVDAAAIADLLNGLAGRLKVVPPLPDGIAFVGTVGQFLDGLGAVAGLTPDSGDHFVRTPA